MLRFECFSFAFACSPSYIDTKIVIIATIMDLSTILLLLETPPPKGGHSLLVDHLYNSARSTPVPGRKRYQHQHQHFQISTTTTTTTSSATQVSLVQHQRLQQQQQQLQNHHHHHHHQPVPVDNGKKQHQLQLLHSKQFYCSNPMLNNNLHCNLDMESLEDMLKKVSSALLNWTGVWGIGFWGSVSNIDGADLEV